MQLAVFMENQLRGPLYCRCRTSAERLHQGMGAADALREEGGDHEMPGQEEFAHSHDNAHEKGPFFRLVCYALENIDSAIN
jgi:hypothetical protein